jgi:predicted nuclease with TOPRIM domain
MTIDERLDRLMERHAALTQTVELLAAAQLKADERMALLEDHLAHVDERLVVLADRTAQLMDTMNRLGNIVNSHEERIEPLEEGQ